MLKKLKEWSEGRLPQNGLPRHEFAELLPDIRQENLRVLRICTLVAVVVLLVLILVNYVLRGFAMVNETGYIVSLLVMVVVCLVVYFVLPKRESLIMPTVYVFALFLYGMGIYLSLLHTEYPAVTAVVFIFAVPLLFHGRTVNMAGMTVFICALFCVLTRIYKSPELAAVDIWNVVSFGVLSIVLTAIMNRTKVRSLVQAKDIQYLSETDMLTGVKNRNCYENRLSAYPDLAQHSVTCVYGDVNGLHDLNNREGHGAGDRMLRTVAEELSGRFGSEHSYRIGGDEFVCFRIDGAREKTEQDLREMEARFLELGYYVSFGFAEAEKESADMQALILEAEQEMYRAKRAYYSQHGRDRRSR